MDSDKVQVSIRDVQRVFPFLEKANELFHQTTNYEDVETVRKFAVGNYEEISELYYDVVWTWLPESFRRELDES